MLLERLDSRLVHRALLLALTMFSLPPRVPLCAPMCSNDRVTSFTRRSGPLSQTFTIAPRTRAGSEDSDLGQDNDPTVRRGHTLATPTRTAQEKQLLLRATCTSNYIIINPFRAFADFVAIDRPPSSEVPVCWLGALQI